MPDTVYLACAADRNFFRFIPTMLNSVRKHTKRNLSVGVFHQGVELKLLDRLESLFPDIHFSFWEIPQDEFKDLPFKVALSPMIYARVLMPRLTAWSKFLYLDLDIIVTTDIGELFDQDLGNNYLGACFFDDDINDGVMSVNGEAWTRDDVEKRVLSYAAENQPKDAEQTAIREVCKGRILRLDPKWNMVVDPIWGPGTLKPEYYERAAITHYITGFKPWNLGYLLLPQALKRRWKDHVIKSGFPVPLRKELLILLYQLKVLARKRLARD